MLQKINEHKEYSELVIEEDLFIKSIATVLSNKQVDDISLTSVVDSVYKLENEINKISEKVFDVHFQQHQTECRKM